MNIIWREDFSYIDVLGRDMRHSPYFPHNSGNLLLHKIMAMPRKRPLSLQDACMKASIENRRLYQERVQDRVSADFLNCIDRWVDWISQQGFHIELTGDEFEIDRESDLAC